MISTLLGAGHQLDWRLVLLAAMATSIFLAIAGIAMLAVASRQDGLRRLRQAESDLAKARDEAEERARRAEAAEAVAGLGRWRVETKTRQITWSEQLYRIYGFEPDAPLDLDLVASMVHRDESDPALAQLARQFETGEAGEGSVIRILRGDGGTRYLLCNSCGEFGPDGAIVAIIGTVVDITARRLAEIAVEESEERFRRLAVNAPDMIAEAGLDGIMTFVSPACIEVTGFTPEELVGRPFSALMEAEDAAKVLAMCQAVFASKGALASWPVEFRARHKSGRQIWLECRPTLATDPKTGRFVGLTDIVRDITQRKALEAELRAARATAEAASAAKGEFLANMSHELRTPLTSVIGFTGLAAEQPDLSPLTRDYIDRVAAASRALLCSVNDILDFSKLEAGQVAIHPQPTRLAALTGATLDLFTPQAGAKDLSLVLDDAETGGDLVAMLDPDRVRQVLLNLVGNAVKFTDVGSVTLRTRYDAAQGTLLAEVIDTGPGIAAEKQDALFKRFSQVDGSLSRSHAGTGLGLAICKGLVEAMGGRIGVESAPGQGSRFWLRIPAPAAEPADAGEDAGPAGRIDVSGVRVLVADDHATNRRLARLFLSGVGGEVTEVEDGEEAVSIAAAAPFDVILMDLRMPNLDGIGALRRIRAGGGCNAATPVIAFTADATTELTDKLMAQGFDGVVAKPIEPAVLIAAVAEAAVFAAASEFTQAA